MLESERTDSARLAAQYGFSGLENVLRALRRDSLRAQTVHLENVFENPIAEVLRPDGETIRHHMVLLMKRNEPSVFLSDMSSSRSSVTEMSLGTGGATRAHSLFHKVSTWTGLSLMLITECLCFQATPALFFLSGGWKKKEAHPEPCNLARNQDHTQIC